VPGRGKLIITGKLGDVMQESAQAAMTYIRSRATELGLERDFYQKFDIHIHVPEGAIPKDGPSAGITMGTAMPRPSRRYPVRSDVAMTGEITLRGKVLPIGGVKEKLLAAHRAGIKTVVLPQENEKDLKEIPAQILKKVKTILVEHMDEVLINALEVKSREEIFKARPEEKKLAQGHRFETCSAYQKILTGAVVKSVITGLSSQRGAGSAVRRQT
jgi:ATP-dependent Lon protease